MADDVTPPTAPTPEVPPTPPAAQPPAPEKTFTQADLDKIVKERLQREREKYANFDELKAASDELAKIKESQLSETEKLTKKLAELETAKTQAETRTRETLIRSAVISEAAKLNFNDPEDAYRLIDVAGLQLSDTGKVEGAAEAVKLLAESRKYLIKNSNPALSTFNPAGGGNALNETGAQKRARIYGGGGNFFDPDRATEMGGGVFWPKGKPEE
jgi:hypothetical protein